MTWAKDDATFQAEELVRRYTDELDQKRTEGHQLNTVEMALVMAEHEQQAKPQAGPQEMEYWLDQLQSEKTPSHHQLQLLNENAKKLHKTWQGFVQHLSSKDQNELNNRNPNWDDVKRVFESVQRNWLAGKEGAYGTAVAGLRNVLQTLHVHKTFLSILPAGNDYASIVCGAIQVLITASATYRKVSEGLSRAFIEINDIVRLCNIDLRLFHGNDLIEKAAELCTGIFKFLEKAISWYTKSKARRFVNAFKEDAYEVFESDVTEIRRISENIRRRAQQGSNVESRTTNLMVQETRAEMKEIIGRLPGIEERIQQTLDTVFYLTQKNLGRNGHSLCISSAKARYSQLTLSDVQMTETTEDLQDETTELIPDKLATKASLIALAHHIPRHLEGCKSLLSVEQHIGTTFVEHNVATALQVWIPDKEAHFLCVIGPWQTTASNPMLLLAAAISSSAAQAEAPLVHASCLPSTSDSKNGLEPELATLFSLVTSLIVQLIDILPDDFESDENIGIPNLDGSQETFTFGMHTLKVLLNASPSPLFCIIDNWQIFDNLATDQTYVTQLITVLREHSENCRTGISKRPFKILITTSGWSVSLNETLEPQEVVRADKLTARHSPGRLKPGRSPISPNASVLIQDLKSENND